ncbi:MAG: sigma-54-dependent Fis family transcriptional regulator [Magnetococcales bacterium]|nr:sigma-54-dependent Fis family transcriptional regulator [Magnetococcales bacterium]NGZ07742.1 sigma-54-dependent Fis family transcriptional regulator [Magnetococcales bacterium]
MSPITRSEEPVIALVDDDPSILLAASFVLRGAGLGHILTVEDGRTLLPLMEQQPVAAVVLDLVMPHLSGQELLPRLVQRHPDTPVIVMTATDEVAIAVGCMKDGAFDFLVKPVDENRFVSGVRKALEWRGLRRQVVALKRSLLSGQLENADAFKTIVTVSPKMRAVFQYVESIAHTAEPVLITGETGVGKELIAEALHRVSGRVGPLVPVNVAGLDDALFADTLFGHKKGAYSGAEESRTGLIAQAARGTLFLDEIGDLGQNSQVKLLRLLQERKYYPLGSDVARVSDARILCATHRDLEGLMAEGRFRADLYFRLQVHRIEIPPLRARPEDIPPLTRHFLAEAATSLGRPEPEIPPGLIPLLAAGHYPGNTRQLRAMLFDAAARAAPGESLPLEPIRKALHGNSSATTAALPVLTEGSGLFRALTGRLPTLKEVEQELIDEAMMRANGNQGVAANFLGISRQALNQRLRKKREEEEPESSD